MPKGKSNAPPKVLEPQTELRPKSCGLLTLEDHRRECDAIAMAKLRDRLNELAGCKEKLDLTPDGIVLLLAIFRDELRPVTDRTLHSGDELEVRADHPAIALLDEHIDALLDLKAGKTHLSLKPNPAGANASATRQERKLDDALKETVLVVQRHEKLPSRTAAEHLVAERLTKAGWKRRDKRITQRALKSIFDHPKKKFS